MTRIRTFNPVAKSIEKTQPRARRPADLEGKRIGLYWNMKSGGDHALDRVEELVRGRYASAHFARYEGASGGIIRMMTAAQADQIAKECDVVIGSTAD